MIYKDFLACMGILLTLTILLGGCSGSSEEQKLADLTKKSEAGDAKAQVSLAEMYYRGEGAPKNIAMALVWYQKAADQGNADAQYALGTIYLEGEIALKDPAKAAEWYQKAATQGNAHAQCRLGLMYSSGDGIPKDMAKALEWFQKAAEQGNAVAQCVLGAMYANGEGVPEDGFKAMELWQKAAAQGLAEAQYGIGFLYERGAAGQKDMSKAVEWYQKAAMHGQKVASPGQINAQRSLARLYANGEGVPKDDAKAMEWAQKAASQGDVTLQASVGAAYLMGKGVGKDPVLAYAWLNLAAAKGYEVAKNARDWLYTTLTPSQLAEAERLSSKWEKGQILVRESGAVEHGGSSAKDGVLARANTGTAFYVTKSGQAITNQHVVANCTEVRAEGREGVVKVITSDAANDIALLQIPGTINTSAAISSDPTKLRQGEGIVVFGFPLNTVLSSGGNLTPGVVSALTGLGNNTNQIQITAPIQPGSSGSPVLNKKGEVVGMVLMKLSDREMLKATGTLGQNVNFAMNGQTLKTFLDTHKVEYRTPWLPSFDKDDADLADEARKWTVVVECWK